MCSCMWWPRPRFWKMLPMLDVIPLNNLAATEKEGRKTIFRIMNNSRFSFPHYSTLGAPVCNCCCYMALVYMYVYILYKRMLSQHTTRLFRIWQFQDSSWCIIREHSSEVRGSCLMKWYSETLCHTFGIRNPLFCMYLPSLFFHFVVLYLFP